MARKPMSTRNNGARDNIGSKTLRLLSIISNLPRSPQFTTCGDLHAALEQEGHAVDKRSVERDLKLLAESREFGALIQCDDSSKPHRWALHKDKHLMVTNLDSSMAVVWDLVGRYVARLLPPAARSKVSPLIENAEHWLKNNTPPGVEPWSRRVAFIPRGMPLYPARVYPAVMETVFDATLKGLQLDIQYGPQKKDFRLHPRAIIDRGLVTYLVASCYDYTDFRLFAMHRIHKAIKLDERINNLSFSLKDYIDGGVLELPQGDMIKLKLRFYNGAGDHLKETPLTPEQNLADDNRGAVTVSAEVRDTEELCWWIQGFGANVEVLAPKSLRTKIGNALKQAAARY